MCSRLEWTKTHSSPQPISFCFYCSFRQWRRGNIALVTTLPVLDCLNSAQHLQPRCLDDRLLPQRSRKKSTAKAQSFQHIIAILPAVLRLLNSVHILAKEIQRKMTAVVNSFNLASVPLLCCFRSVGGLRAFGPHHFLPPCRLFGL